MAKKEKKEKNKTKKVKKPSYLKEELKEEVTEEVKAEMKKVTFPSFKEVCKYTFATILIVAFLIGFFLLLTALLSWVKGAL